MTTPTRTITRGADGPAMSTDKPQAPARTEMPLHLLDFWSVLKSLGTSAQAIQSSLAEAASTPPGGPAFHATMFRLTAELDAFAAASSRYQVLRDEYERGIHRGARQGEVGLPLHQLA